MPLNVRFLKKLVQLVQVQYVQDRIIEINSRNISRDAFATM